MLDRFLAYINNHSLFLKKSKLLVAVSGGKDSSVLVHLLYNGGFKFDIVHCNFRLRDKESEQDAEFVNELAHEVKSLFYTKRFETKKYAEEKGISTQMAARELRYRWFDELLQEKSYDYLLTAHHANDSFETALFNFIKGTGVAGLKGIKARAGFVRRPLLFLQREEIDQYAHDHSIKWREDSSNSSVKYHRNRLRNEVIPILKEINPSIEETFSYTALRMASLEGLLNQSVSDFRNQIEEEKEHLSIASDIISRTELVVIENVMREYGLNLSQVQSLKKSIQEGAVGKLFHTATHSVNIDRDKVYVSRKKRYEPFSILINEDQQSIHTDRGYLQLDLTEDLAISNSKNVVKLDFENISFPLTLRSWRQGDTFYPLGMRGKKKVSDFMIDEKIPLNLKSDVLVLTSGDSIMWIVGRRIDNRYKLTPSTTKALQLTFSND